MASSTSELNGHVNLAVTSPKFDQIDDHQANTDKRYGPHRRLKVKDNFMKDLLGFRLHNPSNFSTKAFGADRLSVPWSSKKETS